MSQYVQEELINGCFYRKEGEGKVKVKAKAKAKAKAVWRRATPFGSAG